MRILLLMMDMMDLGQVETGAGRQTPPHRSMPGRQVPKAWAGRPGIMTVMMGLLPQNDGEEVSIEARGQGSLQLSGAGGSPGEVELKREQDPIGKRIFRGQGPKHRPIR